VRWEHREKMAKERRRWKRREYHRKKRFFGAKNCTFEVVTDAPVCDPDNTLFRRTPCPFGSYRRHSASHRVGRVMATCLRHGRRHSHHELLIRGTRVSVESATVRTVAQLRRAMHERYEEMAVTRLQTLWRGTPRYTRYAAKQSAATRLQALWRGSPCYTRYVAKRAAATRLQARWRGFSMRNNPNCVGCCELEDAEVGSPCIGCCGVEDGQIESAEPRLIQTHPWWQSAKARCCASESCSHQVGGGPEEKKDFLEEPRKWEAKPVGDDSKRVFWLKDSNGNKYGASFDIHRARHPVTHHEVNPHDVEKRDRPDWMKKWMKDFTQAKYDRKRAPWKSLKRKEARNDDVRKEEKANKATHRAKSKPAKSTPEAKDQKAADFIAGKTYRHQARSIPGESEAQRRVRVRQAMGTRYQRQQAERDHDLNRADGARR
jgi:hypothetical protein